MAGPKHPKPARRRDLSLRSLASYIAWAQTPRQRKRKSGKDLDGGGVPVGPERPHDLSGGAAAALEFDE